MLQRNIEVLLAEKGALEAELEAEWTEATDVRCEGSDSRSEHVIAQQDVVAKTTWAQSVHDLSVPKH